MFENQTLARVRGVIDWLQRGVVTDKCPSISALDWVNIERALEDWNRMEWLQAQTKKVVLAIEPAFDSEKPVESITNALQPLPTVEHVGNEWVVRSKHLHLRAAIDAQIKAARNG